MNLENYWQEDFDEVISCGGSYDEAVDYANEKREWRVSCQHQDG